MTVKHNNFKGLFHFLEFTCCLEDMVTSRNCYSVDQVLEFHDESVEDEMENEPCMVGSDDEYDDLVDTSNNTDNYFDEIDENIIYLLCTNRFNLYITIYISICYW